MYNENDLVPFQDQWAGFSKATKKIYFEGQSLKIEIISGFPFPENIKQDISETLKAHFISKENLSPSQIDVKIIYRIKAHAVNQTTAKPLPPVKNIVAIASCKGGVGKSTTALNLAYALSILGAQVGILDADVYGPNLPQMLGQTQKPIITPEKKFEPLCVEGVFAMSIGYLIDNNTPMIWRGPMASKAFEQLLYDTLWPELDYLIIDLPPGTGDIPLTLSQKIPLTGAVMVTTPQSIALADVKKGIEMFQKVGVPLLGVIENMSLYQCSHCGHLDPIFGEGGGTELAEKYRIPLLAKLPLIRTLREAGDTGKPQVLSDTHSQIAKIYEQAAYQLGIQIDSLPVNYSAKFSNIREEKL